MDERRGAWGRLLALFRLVHDGHGSGFVQARGGKLFDPDAFPFLEGRDDAGDPPRVLPVSDGCILRILEGLMTLKARTARAAVLPFARRRADRLGLRDRDGLHRRDRDRALARHPRRQEQPHAGVRRSRRLLAQKGKIGIKALKEEPTAPVSASVAKRGRGGEDRSRLRGGARPIVDERGSPRKHESRARHADPAADRRTPPHRQPLHAAQPHRADRAPRAGAGLRAARAGRDAGTDSRAQGLRSGHGLRRLPGRGVPCACGERSSRPGRACRKAAGIPADEDEDLHDDDGREQCRKFEFDMPSHRRASLAFDRSTIKRELDRNSGARGYRSKGARVDRAARTSYVLYFTYFVTPRSVASAV